MARIRSIKPEFWDARKLAVAVSRDARLLYIGLWNFSDEHSRLNGDPVWIKGHIFPYDSDLGADECARYLDDLARGGWVVPYTVHGDPYLYLPNLKLHQRLEPNKVESKHPSPDEGDGRTPSDLHTHSLSDESAPDPDESARDADELSLLYVAGSMEHVAGSMVAPTDPAQTKPDRPADEIWDALLAVCNVNPVGITDAARGAYNKAVKDLKAIGNVTPTDIRRRAAIYRGQWPAVSMTPTALVRRWSECDRPPPTAGPPPSRNGQILTAARARAEAAEAAQQPEREALG